VVIIESLCADELDTPVFGVLSHFHSSNRSGAARDFGTREVVLHAPQRTVAMPASCSGSHISLPVRGSLIGS